MFFGSGVCSFVLELFLSFTMFFCSEVAETFKKDQNVFLKKLGVGGMNGVELSYIIDMSLKSIGKALNDFIKHRTNLTIKCCIM